MGGASKIVKMVLEEFYLVSQKGSGCFELGAENRSLDGSGNSGMGGG